MGLTKRAILPLLFSSALLVAIASSYDFVCDDAFIVLRYAQNIAAGHGAVYNAGERVEGYTSPLWLLLAVPGALLRDALPRYIRALGAVSGIAMLCASALLFARLRLVRSGLLSWVLVALALCAPVAAWTMGGLETPLFTALVTLACALCVELANEPRTRLGVALGVVLGLAVLTRPEGLLFAGALLLPLALTGFREREVRRAWFVAACVAFAITAAHVAWRLSYYGYPLPNTFYVKSSGDHALLRERGVRYVQLFLRELSPVLPLGILLSVLGAGRAMLEPGARGRRVLTWTARLLWPSYLVYVVSVGGDFLDLYRFFVPLLPLTFVLAATVVAERAGPRLDGWPVRVLACLVLCGFGAQQYRLGERARALREPARAEAGIEPLGWTQLYARRWAAMGRWIARHAQPDDWMAVGAAGAMPYFAGLRNLDTFGLCDAWVAHYAPIVGNRPGHQRFAPWSYILSKRPVFLLTGNDYTRDDPGPLRRDPSWSERGYRWVEARVTVEEFGAPAGYYHYLLMREDRARERSGSPFLRVAPE